jgi:hypothetical protein
MYTIEVQDLPGINEVVIETSLAPVQSINGMVGAVNITASNIGLNNVDNTSDINKPVSIPVSGALLALEQRILSQVQPSSLADIEFQVVLNAGIDSLYVAYPFNFSEKPKSVTCSIENNIDELIYNYFISNVTSSGFDIEFSDYLSSGGYILHVVASR